MDDLINYLQNLDLSGNTNPDHHFLIYHVEELTLDSLSKQAIQEAFDRENIKKLPHLKTLKMTETNLV